jgi:hypothetical protein
MLKSDSSIRFTATEVDELAQLGIDVSGVKSDSEFAMVLKPWLDALAQVRPDLLDKIAHEIAAGKGIRLRAPQDREH